ncbi:hypothetical protein TD95_003053 [Thielaviopsis punctulata]|uniref:RNase III domain-containing protein n=1 Tax=Thielaviopsis punctulata TaxID=72032 RepID=A0A0F4ZHK2_9PEZI|nr:hypothetical protein TD95_003053 [Thielaviopsis punctulata]
MSKRSRDDSIVEDPQIQSSSKRSKDEAKEALNEILEHSDELIECLQALKGDAEKKRRLQKQLAKLSHKLLPSIQALASTSKHNKSASTEESTTTNDTAHEPSQPESVASKPEKTSASTADIQTAPAEPIATPIKEPAEKSQKKGAEAPWYYLTTGWTPEDIHSELPPLPIVDEELKAAAFTHAAFSQNGTQMSYERLEWIGDAYLYVLSSAFIFQTFGNLPTGRCAQLRESLVKNATLAGYFRQYNLGQYARVPPERARATSSRVSENDKETIKVQGDMFEALVAAVVLSSPEYGVARVSQWLKLLWARSLDKQLRELTKTDVGGGAKELGDGSVDVKLSAKTRLANHIQVPGVILTYKDLNCKKKDKLTNMPLYSVGLYLTGWGEAERMIGMATALSKKEAGQKAALQALESTKLMKQYHAKKRAFLEARATEQAAEAGEIAARV